MYLSSFIVVPYIGFALKRDVDTDAHLRDSCVKVRQSKEGIGCRASRIVLFESCKAPCLMYMLPLHCCL